MLCGSQGTVNHSLPGEFTTSPVRIVSTGKALQYNPTMDLQEFFLKQKEAIRGRSREVFALLRQEQFQWRPEKDALSVGEMLRHLWVSEEGVRRVALEGNFVYYETRIPQGLRAVIGAPTTLEEELKQVERVHLETLTAVRELPLKAFDEERVHETLGFRRKVSVILFGINEHEVHHRAQLMTYLRILGTPAPEPFRRR
jgi:uncharacterized damage-inducible protein DinB